ncbi:heavy-metal-associated domain-containing protein [Serinibacter salmoneus]|uniref:Copper chaperone CopZ n=1 Tax=Serinibacter salmoneus TaxID=556530 RepID=A0A2A9D3A3_9MICO|nr:heavy-metal-associated domain-containing protein [Serinibacter salmoneus]PFG20871.1 copper chaperone CopZ [Serinibacter salmoneus]
MTTITTIDVTGMTCGHCVSAVTKELEGVEGVKRVTVELHNGGTSHVTVMSAKPLEEPALREAVDEAGYAVEKIAAHDAAAEFTQLADVRAEVYEGTKHHEG